MPGFQAYRGLGRTGAPPDQGADAESGNASSEGQHAVGTMVGHQSRELALADDGALLGTARRRYWHPQSKSPVKAAAFPGLRALGSFGEDVCGSGCRLSGPSWVDALGADPDPCCRSSMCRLFSRPNHVRSSELRLVAMPRRSSRTLRAYRGHAQLPTEISVIGHTYRTSARATMALCSSVQIFCFCRFETALDQRIREILVSPSRIAHQRCRFAHVSRTSPTILAACCARRVSRRKCCVRAACYSGERLPGGDIFLDLPSRMTKDCASSRQLSIHKRYGH